MTRVALVRHPPPAVAPGLCYGRLPLALRCPDDVTAIAASLAGFSGPVLTSPSLRCRLTAMAIAGGRCRPIEDARLDEMDFGAWEGRAWDAIPRAELDAWAAAPLTYAPPQGESVAALVARCAELARALIAAAADCILVTHGGPLRVLPALLQGTAPDPLAAPPPWGSVRIVTAAPAR